MAITIQEMEHLIKTGFGDSDLTMFRVDGNDIPFQVILQGNGSGPVLWLTISAPLIEVMRTRGHGIKYQTPLRLEKDELVGFVFVDDMDLIEGILKITNLDITDIFQDMQEIISFCEGDVKATGGAICSDKSFAYQISFNFKPSGEYFF